VQTKIIDLPARIVKRIFERGPTDAVRWLWEHFAWRIRERRLGIETETWIEADELGLPEGGHCYEPITYAAFDSIIEHLDIHPDRDVFLDYGCGKGRAVVLAALQPFKRVIGVEYSKDLCDIANKNLAIVGSKVRAGSVEIVQCDAAEYELPAEVTNIYLWNSFNGRVMDRVHENIRKSLETSPRRMVIFSGVPEQEEDMLARLPWLPEPFRLPSKYFTGVHVVVYEIPEPNAETAIGPPSSTVVQAESSPNVG